MGVCVLSGKPYKWWLGKLFLLLGLSFQTVPGTAQHVYSVDSLMEFYQKKAERFLIKSPYVKNYFRIDYRGIHIYGNASQKQIDRPEFILSWYDLDAFKRLVRYSGVDYQYKMYTQRAFDVFDSTMIKVADILEQNHNKLPIGKRKPLSGLRIAIDPGHIAGDLEMAKAEGRFIEMTTEGGEKLSIFEGELTLSTALVLKDSLEAYGAEVMLTRDKGNYSATGLSFHEWRKKALPALLQRLGYSKASVNNIVKNAPNSYIFQKFFNRADLEARADKINAFHPNFTIVLHFNADVKNRGWKRPSNRNYSMMFVPGGYLYNEMNSPQARFEFLRALISDNIEESTHLSSCVMQAMETLLGVPPVPEEEDLYYLERYSLKIDNGIYARNLRLCRILNTPICYGEALIQDNEEEIRALAQNDLKNGVIAPRIRQVAQAYFRGILRYVQQRQHDREYW